MINGNPLYAIQQTTNSKTAQNTASALRIVVVSGEDAVNIIQQKTAVAPLVEVRDRNNQPVAGALVTFTIQGGTNATFAGASTMTATTNALGQAAAASFTPTGAGAVQINVAAAFQGQSAAAAITQTNFMTAAQAAAAGSSASTTSTAAGGSSGGGVGAGTITTLGLVGAGVAGGYYAYRKHEMGEAPIVESVSVMPAAVFQGWTPVTVSMSATWHGDARMRIDFGDGTTEEVDAWAGNAELFHVYANAGTYTVRVTLVDAWDRSSRGETTVTVKSLNGRWSVENTPNFFVLTQNGAAVSGTYTTAAGPGSGTVSGTLTGERLQSGISLTVSPTSGGNPTTFQGGPDFESADIINGTLRSGTASSFVRLRRQ